jgi:hypothetical protein
VRPSAKPPPIPPETTRTVLPSRSNDSNAGKELALGPADELVACTSDHAWVLRSSIHKSEIPTSELTPPNIIKDESSGFATPVNERATGPDASAFERLSAISGEAA